MENAQSHQCQNGPQGQPVSGDFEAVIPNPKLRLMDQVREVLRLKHYAIRTEQCYCDWIRRYIEFHGMRAREELFPAEAKIEQLCPSARGGHTHHTGIARAQGRVYDHDLYARVPARRVRDEKPS
jgi:hypothetical protein